MKRAPGYQTLLGILILHSFSYAQVTVEYKPESVKTTKSVYGSGKSANKWNLLICNEYPGLIEIDRARIMMAAPSIHEIPNQEAEDLLTRQAQSSIASLIGENGATAVSLASSGLTTAAITSTSVAAKTAGKVGIAIEGALLIVSLFKKAEPNPGLYFSGLLPNTVSLQGSQCSSGYWVLSSASGKIADTVGPVTIWLPGNQLPPVKSQP